MKIIEFNQIADAVERLCVEANNILPKDMCDAIKRGSMEEVSPVGKGVFSDIIENFTIAANEGLPICQDTGMAVVFCDMGQEVHIVGGLLSDAVNEGVCRGYINGRLRCSVVSDPLKRINTGDNTPAMLHIRLVEGDGLDITVAPKGFGSENMSSIKMFNPSAGREEILEHITSAVSAAGSNPCPPIILGVGLGGTFEKAALLAKRALLREAGFPNPDPFYAEMEKEALERINRLGIGPMGLGGRVTALAVHIETLPTHIAGLPCAINFGCHATRHAHIGL